MLISQSPEKSGLDGLRGDIREGFQKRVGLRKVWVWREKERVKKVGKEK